MRTFRHRESGTLVNVIWLGCSRCRIRNGSMVPPPRLGKYINKSTGILRLSHMWRYGGMLSGCLPHILGVVEVITNGWHLENPIPPHLQCFSQSPPSHRFPGQCDPTAKSSQSPFQNALFLLKLPQSVPHSLALKRQSVRNCGHPPHTSSSVLATSACTSQPQRPFAQTCGR